MIARIFLLLAAVIALAACSSLKGYEPAEGDVVFQALPKSPLRDLISGSTDSPFSHCGIVLKREGKWLVIEAIGPVREIELESWVAQGAGGGFAAYRLREEKRVSIPTFIAAARRFLGRPYDSRYRFDDERIYCSELVFKAWRIATSEDLGKVRKVSELKWQPYRATIEQLEGGPVPLDRELITPRDLSEASQLVQVFRKGI